MGVDPVALRELFPIKRSQRIMRSLTIRAHQNNKRGSEAKQTAETLEKFDKVDVRPEDLRPFFTGENRFKRDDTDDVEKYLNLKNQNEPKGKDLSPFEIYKCYFSPKILIMYIFIQ